MFLLLLLIGTASALPVLPEAPTLPPIGELPSPRTNIKDGVTVAPEVIKSTVKSNLPVLPEAPVLKPLEPSAVDIIVKGKSVPEFNFVFPTPKSIEEPIKTDEDLPKEVEASESVSQPMYVKWEWPNIPIISPALNPIISGLGSIPFFGGLFGSKPTTYRTYNSYRYPYYAYGYPETPLMGYRNLY